MVILDEASSRLDPTTEMLIKKAIAQLLQDRTAIILVHRLKTIQKADRILILERGKVIEYGDRLALIQNPDSLFQVASTGFKRIIESTRAVFYSLTHLPSNRNTHRRIS